MHQNFDQWMARVNAELDKICGMDSDDLPDYDYADDYENFLTANTSAHLAIRNAGGNF